MFCLFKHKTLKQTLPFTKQSLGVRKSSFLLFHYIFLPFARKKAKFNLSLSTIIAFMQVQYHLEDIWLTHYQTTNFRLLQTERVCRRQFQI